MLVIFYTDAKLEKHSLKKEVVVCFERKRSSSDQNGNDGNDGCITRTNMLQYEV